MTNSEMEMCKCNYGVLLRVLRTASLEREGEERGARERERKGGERLSGSVFCRISHSTKGKTMQKLT